MMGMPLGRYFVIAGSLLLMLLFVADWYMPKLAVMTAVADADKTVIRIQSGHKWPEAIVFDTSLPTIAPPVAEATTPVEKSPGKSPRDALAQVPLAELVPPFLGT